MEPTAGMREQTSTFTAQRWESEFTATILAGFFVHVWGEDLARNLSDSK